MIDAEQKAKLDNVVYLIEAIGEVNLDSNEAIEAAEMAFEALAEEEKSEIKESGDKLEANRASYEKLVMEHHAADVIDSINAIGKVTLDSEDRISSTRKAYDALNDDEKALVTNFDALQTAESQLMDLHATNVIDSINIIGEVTLASEESIENARKAYNALKAAEKELVTNIDVLKAAEAQYKTLLQEEKQRILAEAESKFDKHVDKVEGITWYFHKNMPQYINQRCFISTMIAVRDDDVWMCHRYNYAGNSWVFWESVIFSIDGSRKDKSFSYNDVIRQAGGGTVGEYHDEPLDINLSLEASDIKLIEDIANSTETIMRFKGDDYTHDYIVNDTDKQVLRDGLALYKALLP